MLADKIIATVIALSVIVGVTIAIVTRRPHKNVAPVSQIQVGDNLSVERVPVFGKYVTCVIDKETDSFGNPRHSISCDWVGYHSK